MGIYEELQARGLIAQVTDEAEIRDLINRGGAKFYIGFDPTARGNLKKQYKEGVGQRRVVLVGAGHRDLGVRDNRERQRLPRG